MYNPNYYYPYQQPQAPVAVMGIEGAKAYNVPPNSAAVLFDRNDDVFYLKTTDQSGYPTLRMFTFKECEQPNEQAGREEIESLRKEMEDVKQHIRTIAEQLGAAGGAGD